MLFLPLNTTGHSYPDFSSTNILGMQSYLYLLDQVIKQGGTGWFLMMGCVYLTLWVIQLAAWPLGWKIPRMRWSLMMSCVYPTLWVIQLAAWLLGESSHVRVIPDDELCIPYPLSHTVGWLSAEWKLTCMGNSWWWAVVHPTLWVIQLAGCLLGERSHVRVIPDDELCIYPTLWVIQLAAWLLGERSHVCVDSWWWAVYIPYLLSHTVGCLAAGVNDHMYGLIPDDELGIPYPLSHITVGCLAAGVKDHMYGLIPYDELCIYPALWVIKLAAWPLGWKITCMGWFLMMSCVYTLPSESYSWLPGCWVKDHMYGLIPDDELCIYPTLWVIQLAAWLLGERSHVWVDSWWWAVYIPYPLSHTVGCLAVGVKDHMYVLIPDDELCIYPALWVIQLAAWLLGERSHVCVDSWWWAVYIPYLLSHTVGWLAGGVNDHMYGLIPDDELYIPYPLSHAVGWLSAGGVKDHMTVFCRQLSRVFVVVGYSSWLLHSYRPAGTPRQQPPSSLDCYNKCYTLHKSSSTSS